MSFDCKKAFDAGLCNADCCGVIPFNKDVFEKIKHLATVEIIQLQEMPDGEVVPFTKDMKCPFLNRAERKCMVYEYRPQVCKDFGNAENLLMTCPYMKPNGNFWSEAKQKQIHRATAIKIKEMTRR